VPAARRRIDWQKDATEIVLRKIRSADSSPGARGILFGEEFHLFGVESEDSLRGGAGEALARRGASICVATIDGAVWISHLRRPREVDDKSLKLPATAVLGERAKLLRDITVNLAAECIGPDERPGIVRDGEIIYQEDGAIGSIYFPFYNGAMSTEACLRLNEMVKYAVSRPTRVLVLWGGSQFWSNGLNLNLIESSADPAEESWRNINAMDDLVRTLIACETHLTIAVLRGNAGAGGAFLALAADRVFARRGIVLNPHYKNMGNLFGSEYWTYSLPKRAGAEGTKHIMDLRLPIGTTEAAQMGLIDAILPDATEALREEVLRRANEIAGDRAFEETLRAKVARRHLEEAQKPLDRYREEELKRMRLNFFGFDSSYHVARYNFVYKVPMSKTPLHLASHRRINKS
jgi:putative two-component system hydrogenase maturation factor HypX/HoxX